MCHREYISTTHDVGFLPCATENIFLPDMMWDSYHVLQRIYFYNTWIKLMDIWKNNVNGEVTVSLSIRQVRLIRLNFFFSSKNTQETLQL